MKKEQKSKNEDEVSRRKFVAGATVAGAAAAVLPIESSAQVAGSDAVKVGMIGMGGRGSGAIVQNLTANDSSQLYACADAFQDKIDGTGPRASGLPKITQQLEKLGKNKQVDFRTNWVMGHLKPFALGSIKMKELRKAVKAW
jgi:hypothetical protein